MPEQLLIIFFLLVAGSVEASLPRPSGVEGILKRDGNHEHQLVFGRNCNLNLPCYSRPIHVI